MHDTRMNLTRMALATVLSLVLAAPTWADDNPGYDRPGLGFTPAVLQAGDVTWEQGLPDWSASDGAAQYTADALLRVGLGGPLEFQLGSSYNYATAGHDSAWGRGDTSLGLKLAPPTTGNFSWGLLGSVEFVDGGQEFRNDDPAYLLGAAFNWQLDPDDSLGAYLENVQGGGQGNQLIALNAGRALTEALGAYVEVAWQHVADAGDGTMAGAGLTWMATPRLQLDASFRHRLGGAADTWQAGFGVSMYFGHVGL